MPKPVRQKVNGGSEVFHPVISAYFPIMDLVHDRMRLEVLGAQLKADATQVDVILLCQVDMIPFVKLLVYCEKNKSTGYD